MVTRYSPRAYQRFCHAGCWKLQYPRIAPMSVTVSSYQYWLKRHDVKLLDANDGNMKSDLDISLPFCRITSPSELHAISNSLFRLKASMSTRKLCTVEYLKTPLPSTLPAACSGSPRLEIQIRDQLAIFSLLSPDPHKPLLASSFSLHHSRLSCHSEQYKPRSRISVVK